MDVEPQNDNLFFHQNIWPLVLEFIPANIRPLLSEVSKLWHELVAGSWRAFEISLTQQPKEELQEFTQRIDNMIHYLKRHSKRLVDVNICLNFQGGAYTYYNNFQSEWLNKLLRIKTLKRLHLHVSPKSKSPIGIDSELTCHGLELLNLRTLNLKSQALEDLLLNLPNLVELYVGPDSIVTSVDMFKHAKKLQRLMVHAKGISSEDIIAACPSLKYLIRPRSDQQQISSVIGKTLVVSTKSFKLKNLANIEHLKRIIPLLNEYCYSADTRLVPLLTWLALHPERHQEVIEFLVNEAKFNINIGPPDFLYRPTLCKKYSTIAATYPLEVALKSKNLDLAWRLIELGAHVECPNPADSFFGVAGSDEMLKLLVDSGADLHKLVSFQENETRREAPIYKEKFPAFMIPTLKNKDSRNFIDLIKSRVNLNIVVNGRSFLEWAIVKGCWETYIALLNAGAHWTSGALYSLLAYAPDRFERVVTKKDFDMELITPMVAALAVQQGYAHLLTKYFVQSPNVLDENGFGCLHYITLLSAEDTYYGGHSHDEGYDRWVVPKARASEPESIFSRDSDGWSDDYAVEDWSDEVVDEDNDMMVDEAQEEEDISLDTPKEFKIEQYIEDAALKRKSQWQSPQQQEEIDEPKPSNPFAYNSGAKTLKNFFEALDLLHGDINLTTKEGEGAVLLLCRSNMTRERKVGRLKALLAKRADVRIPDKNGWTPLHAACYQQEFRVFEVLLQAGADINARDKYGNTPLMVGYKSDLTLLSELGEKFSLADFTRFYFKALQLADKLNIKVDLNAAHPHLKKQFIHHIATLGTPEFLNYIADRVDINSQDANGLTPLHHAILMCNSLMVQELIKLGANPNIPTHSLKMTPAMLFMHMLTKGKDTTPDENSKRLEGNPFMKIAWFESPYMMWLLTNETLIESDFRYRDILRNQDKILLLSSLKDAPWLEYAHSLNEKFNYNYRTKLVNIENTLDLLLSHSDLMQIDSHGNTYLHLAVMYHTRPGCIWQIESLLEKFPQLNRQWNIKNDYHDTPFSLMCQACKHFQGFIPVIKSVIKQYDVNVNDVDGHGHSPLHYLIHHVERDDFLVDLELPMTWSSVTICQPTTIVIDRLLEYKLTKETLAELTNGASSKDLSGQTFLMRILRGIFEQNRDYWAYLDVLLQHKAHLNVQDNNGNTALHIACKYFHLGLVESILGKINNTRYSERFFVTVFKLLEAGCDPSIKNKRGETPQDYVPHLHEYYQSLYLDWIKGLNYKDDMTITYEGLLANKQTDMPERTVKGLFDDEDDWDNEFIALNPGLIDIMDQLAEDPIDFNDIAEG